MTPTIADVDPEESLARLVDLFAGSGKAKLGDDEKAKVVNFLSDLFVRSTLQPADIAKQFPPSNVGKCFLYSKALAESWSRMTPDRRSNAIHWIESLPPNQANGIRVNLIPSISEQDPRSARLMLPARALEPLSSALELPGEVARFKNWLRPAGPLESLLKGELAEHEVTRVLKVMLRLAGEPAVAVPVRSSVLLFAAEAITERGLAETTAGMERIFPSLTHLLQTLPPIDADAASEKLRQRTPKVALRLGLVEPQPERGSSGGAGNPGLEIGNDEEAPISQTKIASPASNPLVPEPPRPRALREPTRAVSALCDSTRFHY